MLTTEEIQKVIEDKAIAAIQGEAIQVMSHLKEYFEKGMQEALTNPTDIGLCRWVNAETRFPEKEDNYYIKILGYKHLIYFNGKRFEANDNFKISEIEWLEEPNQ